MKIVHINTTDNRGGAAQVAYSLHTALNKMPNIESRMLVREKNTNDPSVDTFGITGWKRWLSVITAHNHTFLGGTALLAHPWIQEADIIHLHNLHGYYFHLPILKELAKTKQIIWTLHDMWTMTPHCGSTLVKNPDINGLYQCNNQFEYEPILLPRSRTLGKSKKLILENIGIAYITPSKFMMDKLQKSYLKNHECVCIPNGVDTNIFHNQKNIKTNTRKELRLSIDKKIALLVANNFNDKVKGKETIIKLIEDKRLSHLQFIAIGKGQLPINSKLLRIQYPKDKVEIARYYTSADVYLHPALIDNFPTVIIESLLSGTPVVAYDVGGIKEQVRDGIDGQMVEANNYESFVQNILKTLERNSDNSIIADRAKKEFSKDSMTNNYLALYKKLLR